jgi:copper(I)-binding protein
MKKTLQTLLASAFLVMPLPAFSMDNEYAAGDLTLKGPWARVTLQNLPAAAFVTIHNSGNADKIVGVSSPAAERVEMHTHLNENGVMKMRQINGIDVPANSVTELKTGSFHLMIFKLKTLFKPGDMIPLTITFEKAGTVDVRATVKSMKPMKMDHNNTNTN